jgi:hypothetical protein
VQTPLSDEPAEDSADDEDCEEEDCVDFSEPLEDSATLPEDESAELELGTVFVKLLEESSPTAAGEPSDESPHATSAIDNVSE